jgi:dihydropteroate synthase
VGEIKAELEESVSIAIDAGIEKNSIIIDPGIGFGKRLEDNLRIIRYLGDLKTMGFPILIGVSRKSFLGQILDKPVDERLIATIAANTMAVMNGADILRVHDYREAVQMARVIEAVSRVNRC